MTRLEALEKVAEAAQKWADAKSASWVARGLLKGEAAALYAAVANLRALPPARQGARRMTATCETCRWWDNIRNDVGICRRYAPQPTLAQEWCGEHTPKEKEPSHE